MIQSAIIPALPPADLLQIFANDQRMILYRPEWRKITGSVTATILLQQVLYRWDKNNREPFYKFREPCNHALCRDGDTWTQELGFSKFEFDNALKKIAFKRTGKTKDTENTDKPVEYWTDINRTTYYTVVPEILTTLLSCLYSGEFMKINKMNLPVNQDSGFTSFNTETTKNDVPPAPQQPPPMTPPTAPPSPSPVNFQSPIAFSPPAQPPTPGTQTAPATDMETAIAALVLLVPESMRKPSVIAKIAGAVKDGIALELIESCIEYSNDKSDKATWQRYRAHLGQCIDGQWGDGYSGKDAVVDTAAKDKAAIKGRLDLPISILTEQAKAGDKYAIAALEIIKKE